MEILDETILIVLSGLISTFMSLVLPPIWKKYRGLKMVVISIIVVWLIASLVALCLIVYITGILGLT